VVYAEQGERSAKLSERNHLACQLIFNAEFVLLWRKEDGVSV